MISSLGKNRRMLPMEKKKKGSRCFYIFSPPPFRFIIMSVGFISNHRKGRRRHHIDDPVKRRREKHTQKKTFFTTDAILDSKEKGVLALRHRFRHHHWAWRSLFVTEWIRLRFGPIFSCWWWLMNHWISRRSDRFRRRSGRRIHGNVQRNSTQIDFRIGQLVSFQLDWKRAGVDSITNGAWTRNKLVTFGKSRFMTARLCNVGQTCSVFKTANTFPMCVSLWFDTLPSNTVNKIQFYSNKEVKSNKNLRFFRLDLEFGCCPQ